MINIKRNKKAFKKHDNIKIRKNLIVIRKQQRK